MYISSLRCSNVLNVLTGTFTADVHVRCNEAKNKHFSIFGLTKKLHCDIFSQFRDNDIYHDI